MRRYEVTTIIPAGYNGWGHDRVWTTLVERAQDTEARPVAAAHQEAARHLNTHPEHISTYTHDTAGNPDGPWSIDVYDSQSNSMDLVTVLVRDVDATSPGAGTAHRTDVTW